MKDLEQLQFEAFRAWYQFDVQYGNYVGVDKKLERIGVRLYKRWIRRLEVAKNVSLISSK